MNPSTKRKRADTSYQARNTKGIRSLPNELIGQIVEEVMKDIVADTKTRNRTRSLPLFVSSLKCDINHADRRQYIFALSTCNRKFIHSLHFGNDWNVLNMDCEELQSVQNVVIKFLPTSLYERDPDILYKWHQIREVLEVVKDRDLATKMREEVVNVEVERSNLPSVLVLKSSLECLPKVRSVQMEFKGSRSAFSARTFVGMFRRVKAFLTDNKDYTLKAATIECGDHTIFRQGENRQGWTISQRIIKRISIPEVTEIVGREVWFLITNDTISDESFWKLEDVAQQEIDVVNILHHTVDNSGSEHPTLPLALKILVESKWTWVLERDV